MKANKMGKAKIIKASEIEIEEFLNECNHVKNTLLDLIEELNKKYDNIPPHLLHEVNILTIEKISDCQRLGNYLIEIGKYIKNKENVSLFLKPVGNSLFQMTLIEGLVLSVLGIIVLGLIALNM